MAVVTVTSASGRQDRRRRRARTYGEARTKLHDLQGDLAAGVSPERVTVAAFFARWLDRQHATAKSPNTIANYEWAINGHIGPALGHILLRQLRADDVDDLLMAMGHPAAIGPTTRGGVRTVLGGH
ncbi:MAG: tyrosine-type recombinase/integrase [Acidimicrobiales bacterium]